jgi:acetyl/propionyl-CoA carboxylase alpha subunit
LKRLLISNRAEIAVRIARTAHEMGIATVGVSSAEDSELARGYPCDLVVPLEGRGASAYLDAEQIAQLAAQHGCDAVHPGYGFLSESPAFVRAVESAGLGFVGPAAATLELFGDKVAARAHAERVGVRVLPGTGANASTDDVRQLLSSLPTGGAVMLKACAGGGGRGIRAVRSEEEIDEAHARCQSEALRSFGSDALLAERLIERPRHVEVQIVGDATGALCHLWERECTLQRRHQKLIEIAPSPSLEGQLRDQLLEAALAMARASDYLGLGTFEFLIDESGEFFFMEANPRLQVEHTVTEEVTGLDLVEIQLRIARGETLAALGLAKPPTTRGHAIQARIYAETIDPEGNAQPAGGEISVFDPPSGPGIRVDTAARRGLSPSPAFDSLLAKLIVSSPVGDYRRAVDRLRRALGEFRIEGTPTNLSFLRALAERDEFASNTLSTAFIREHAAELVRAAEGFAHGVTRGGEPAPLSSPTTIAAAPPGFDGVYAPMIGTVIEVRVGPGDLVRTGETICVLEAMKMEHLVPASRAGTVRSVLAAVGDVLQEAAPIVWIEPADQEAAREETVAAIDLDARRTDLSDMQARHAKLEDESRPRAVERRRERGQRTARENLHDLCDPDSFIEYGGLAVAAMRKTRTIEDLEANTPADAIITGLATVNADQFGPEAARCAVLVVDATVLAGTQGFFHHIKIDRILQIAERHGAPVVFYPEGGGGRPNDTDPGDIFVAGLNVTSFHAFARLSGKVPRVSVVSGFCFAGSAAFAGCADVIIATRNTSIGMGGPAMIEGGGLGVFTPEEVGPVSELEPLGVVDLVVEDEQEATAAARRYLSYFQGDVSEWTCADQRLLRHAIPENRRRVYDVRHVIEALCDTDSVMELRRAYGVGMVTALVRIEGRAYGLISNDPTHLGGAIDDAAAEKAARFLQLCDAFGLPVVSLCDTPGFMVGPEIERKAQVRKVSRLFTVGASLSVPFFTVILRKGYGLGAQAMAGGSFVAPSFTISWPTGEIGGMGLEGAVRLGFRRQLESIEDEDERNALFEKLVDRLYERGKALNAASQLEFDAVIDPEQTRRWISRGLHAAGPLGPGSGRFVDTW